MKKFLSIIGLTGVLLFAGNAAYAVEESPAPKPIEYQLPAATGKIIPLKSLDPVTPRDNPPVFVDYVPPAAPATPAPAIAPAAVPEPVAATVPLVTPEAPAPAAPAGYSRIAPLAVVPAAVPGQAECEAAGHIWAGTFCYDREANNSEWLEDCPRGPDGECYSEAVPYPGDPVEVTTEPVTERTELAYTGADDVILATVGLLVGLAGVGLVRHSLRMRREAM